MNSRIIYLEDDEFTRLMVQAQLEKAGYEVESYSNFADTVRALKEKNFDLIISDLHLESEGPQELISGLKAVASIPIVTLSGKNARINNQVDLLITKPLTPEKIKKIEALMPQEDDVDISQVYQFACGDEELLTSYIGTFMESYQKDLVALKEDIESKNTKAVYNRAHKMLSAVSYYKCQDLNQLLRYLESEAHQLTQEKLREIYDQVKEHSDKLLVSLQKKIAV